MGDARDATEPMGNDVRDGEVAIVGIGCRFPGVANGDDLWEMVSSGRDEITEVPPDRFPIDDFYDPRAGTPGKLSTRYGGFIDGVGDFDAEFFGITPREAARTDPQHRILLEVAWEALEDAQYRIDSLRGSAAGVYVGMLGSDYQHMVQRRIDVLDVHTNAGSAGAVAAGRLSHAFGLTGPAVTVDTACSSSLVSVHIAAGALRNGDIDLALAAGINLILLPEGTVGFSQSGMTAPDGRCKFGDAAADGMVRSDGIGVVVLKRLDDAIAAGDHIYGVIAGSAVNNDGGAGGLLITRIDRRWVPTGEASTDEGVAQ